jgi:glycine hydroxymethyltransferase
MIVAGASAFPWSIDWARLRVIADSLPRPAQILADISHPAGLVVAGLFPNPVGIADVITFTTHKTMIGPRAAVILTTSRDIARRVDRAIFPGEQGGPHINSIAAMAVAFGIAKQPEFHALQRRIVENAQALARGLERRGLKLAYGGTDTHLLLIDLKSLPQASGVPVNGDLASRILDVAGIVCNKNTIAGDASAVYPTGLRLGTVWASQRGLGPDDMDRIAGLVHRALTGITTFVYQINRGPLPRGKVDPAALDFARGEVAALVARTADAPERPEVSTLDGAPCVLQVRGSRAGSFLQTALPADVLALRPGEARPTLLRGAAGEVLARVSVARIGPDDAPEYLLLAPVDPGHRVATWLRDLSDGYVQFDRDDVFAKVSGPAAIDEIDVEPATLTMLLGALEQADDDALTTKPYFVGQWRYPPAKTGHPDFAFSAAGEPLRRTPLHGEHRRLGARMVPFAGWEMPVWYSGIAEEHATVRDAAGLFDLAHMGVLEVAGEGATRFLDLVSTNHVAALDIGKAQYSYVLNPDGQVLDDILIYKRDAERYLVIVNASNAERDLSWLRAVASRECAIDRDRTDRVVDVEPTIRDLRDPASGGDRRINLAIQGPRSLAILLAAIEDPTFRASVWRLRRFEFAEGSLFGAPALVSRTGYTGEQLGYEVCIHPDRALPTWRGLLDVGASMGLKPIGLGARDSLRIEAGFPLYGHELAGDHGISPLGAGYPGFVKFHKPFFVGRRPALAAEAGRRMALIRFRVNERGGRMPRAGDKIVERRGEVVGFVTSCTAVEGVPIGLAYVSRAFGSVDTAVGILPTGGGRSRPEVGTALRIGDRVTVQEAARALSRFRSPERSPAPASPDRA